jgi:AraC-like DNA-binding protein
MKRLGSAGTAQVFGFTLPADRSVAVPAGCVVFVRSGAVAWQTRSSDVLVDVNHALLYPRDAQPSVLTAIEFDAELTVLQAALADYGVEPCVRLIDSPAFLEHYRLAFRAYQGDAPDRVAHLTAAVRTNASKKPASRSAHSPTYGRAMQLYLNAALARPFSLRDVAQACALSPFTASRVFHREAGIPLRIYVRRLRVRTSLARILAGRDLSAVAQDLGFFDHAHFTKAFRREFGIAPSQWREFIGAELQEGHSHAHAS